MTRALLLLGLALAPAIAFADEHPGEVRASLDVFSEPAPAQSVTVVTPSVSGKVDLKRWLSARIDWNADVVTGATPRTYGAPDVISSATAFSELRNSIGAQLEARTGPFSAHAGYRFGIENDYRSHVLTAGARVDLFDHNTVIAADYAHNFDSVCDLDNRGLAVTQRQPLSSSVGCFAGHPGLVEEPLAIDSAEVSVTQTLTPRLIGALVGYSEHVAGFQSNPYRRVRLDGGMVFAQESHPLLRDRGAVGVRLRYAFASKRAVLGADVRLYRDSWEIQSITGELSWDHLVLGDRLRYRARVRYYQQSQASFFRDAGASNSYERTGPVGQYFTGDRELSPFGDLLVGGALFYRTTIRRAFHSLEAGVHADLIKVFANSITPPNLPRTTGVIDALSVGLSAVAAF